MGMLMSEPKIHIPDAAARHISDFSTSGEEPVIEPKRNVLTAGMIQRRNLTPIALVELLQRGDVLRLRRSYRSMLPYFLLLILTALLVVALIVMFPDNMVRAIFAGLVVSCVLIAVIMHQRADALYEVSWELISSTYGKRAGTQKTLTLTAKQLRSTEVRQTIPQKILGVGDISVSDMVPDQKDISMENLYQPYFYSEVIRELNRRHQSEEGA